MPLEEPNEWTYDGRMAAFLPPGARLAVVTQDGARHIYAGAPERASPPATESLTVSGFGNASNR
ncbi:hypothetical protein SAMN04489726_0981 [Allokutzneria albata]|uniref:Uncharacterized protein n=1 Tax=Allokutzneria albata TaxID=211114 RepID=A0A1G9S936_ALLAB|nr:hypothetical protein SAMN04489726_0981 [Allokutzneria albata]